LKVNVMKSGNVFWMEIPKAIIASAANIEEGSTLQIKTEGLGKFTVKLAK